MKLVNAKAAETNPNELDNKKKVTIHIALSINAMFGEKTESRY